MDVGEYDPVTGRETTGHEWNGIKELNTPVPRVVLFFLAATATFAVLWWFLMPAWPLGSTYTKGLLGIDQREIVTDQLQEAKVERAAWVTRIESSSYDEIQADPTLMRIVQETGPRLYGDNCAACHGVDAKGAANYPDLTDDDWLWGGEPETIAETMRVGINSPHDEGRLAQMPAFGRDQMLDRPQINDVAAYVLSLSDPAASTSRDAEKIAAGKDVFLANCAACHGDDATGSRDLGAPNLSDQTWLYGGNLQTIITTIHGGRQGHMPTWENRLSPADINILALYVHSLGGEAP
ncbi:cytochrome-c oxidase, cbb3-type subunit III [Aurantimonas sp. C2-6-R+9]|uniref:cytochrome-c oxidase, cbb3-type subunit III n=1 Tax=unclassified Aurantimonas TaxID=2638230 RepID=UPI002E178A6D|nr:MULTISPECIES: cytochrome-c oxidase, cbb3-type subunit III [unclassified Aurantimonas]MEC5290959.1 cytochrome-c oxidase, cbb3-type subunit III [Aurantimonas sp. C2-3-R2]MEC5381286.1 cytochrome-c oxidase, cbb3-type subunit III [Aurantimonas sp. C2-6-R+9]MEC5412109.1 cytochrome-c oxidase, cbb3-type subunit III [Aurantimonas sp. C2-4-R8]